MANCPFGGTVLGEDFEPNRTADVTLTVTGPDGSVYPIAPRPSTAEGFTFEHAFTAEQAGIYQVTARSTVESTGAEISHEAVFLATAESPELASVNLNEPMLRQIASVTGGAYVHLSEYDELVDTIQPLEGSLYKNSEQAAWDSKWILILLIGLLIGEWLARRAGGLA